MVVVSYRKSLEYSIYNVYGSNICCQYTSANHHVGRRCPLVSPGGSTRHRCKRRTPSIVFRFSSCSRSTRTPPHESISKTRSNGAGNRHAMKYFRIMDHAHDWPLAGQHRFEMALKPGTKRLENAISEGFEMNSSVFVIDVEPTADPRADHSTHHACDETAEAD